MMDGGNGLTSWFECLRKNKLTMFGAHCPFNPPTQLAESKVFYEKRKMKKQPVMAIRMHNSNCSKL